MMNLMASSVPALDGFRRHLLRWAWIDGTELDEVLDSARTIRGDLTPAEALNVAREAVRDLLRAELVWFTSEPGPDGRKVEPAEVEGLLGTAEVWRRDGLTMWPTREGDSLAVGYEAWHGPSDTWPTEQSSPQ
jgi:hypothetical protein